jgi:subtilase family serine protease
LALKNSAGEKSEWGWGTWITSLNNPTILDGGKQVTATGLSQPFIPYIGSGGGVSFVMRPPVYQKHVVPAKLATQTYLNNGLPVPLRCAGRVTPDISMDADPYTGALVGETFSILGIPAWDADCMLLPPETFCGPMGCEYCERSGPGGTSLSTPLFAGVLALVNEARHNNHLTNIGFANPKLYALKTGPEGSGAPITDITAPTEATALLIAYQGQPNVDVITVNSAPNASNPCVIATNTVVTEGADMDYCLVTQPGFDAVTGLGTPNIPALIEALGSH